MNKIPTQILGFDNPEIITRAVTTLDFNGLIVFPTDTLYGLAGRINEISIQKIYAAKQRPAEKAIPVLIGDLDHLDLIVRDIQPQVLTLMRSFWPGALTLILPKRSDLPVSLSPYEGLAVRMPKHPFALKLLQETGPLAVTSANISSFANPTTAQDVYAQLKDRASLIIDGGKLPQAQASTIVDCLSDQPKLIRKGPIAFEQILQQWNK
jgi:L-threonylcarbamoyladenylate synthase